MIRNILYRVCILFAILILSSCNKWLDLKPQDGIIRQEYWKTKEHVQAAVTGIYSSLLNEPLVYNLFIWGELRGDMLAVTPSTLLEEQDIMRTHILPSNSLTSWRAVYKTINYCNTLIDFAPQVLESDPTFKQEDLNSALAEARAIRAWMYFYLLRTFGEVPKKDHATSSDATLEQLSKSSKEEIYNFIVEDLLFAEQHAVTTFKSSVAKDKGRITRYAVWALQADVYLWMDDYQKCIDACDKIIASKKFGLIEGFSQSFFFNSLYYNGNSNESIFEIQFDQQKLSPFSWMFAANNRRFIASMFVMDEHFMVEEDVNKFDIRGDRVSVRSSDFLIWKYSGANSGLNADLRLRETDESYAHWFVYRYADILLLRAEALNWVGRSQEALDHVYEIRQRANALDKTDLKPDVGSPSDVAYFILQERAREFAFEGKRWFDVLRNAKRNNYENISFLLDMVRNAASGSNQQATLNKYRDYNSHYLPIHDYELTTDKNLVQNPFYK
jgi:starch-binding outer membrane protein, SusD/RagB family